MNYLTVQKHQRIDQSNETNNSRSYSTTELAISRMCNVLTDIF